VATRVDHNIHSSGEKIELPIHLLNDQYLDFPGAKVSWKLIEETDSFIIKGNRIGKDLTIVDMIAPGGAVKGYFQVPVTATIGHQVPVATVIEGQTVANLPPDSHLIAAIVRFSAPRTTEVKHYTLYMTLAAADGQVLSENWDHFIVAPKARNFRPPEGLTPAPRFQLELALKNQGAPLAQAQVQIADKYVPNNQYSAKLDENGRATLNNMVPGAYRLTVNNLSYEFLLNRDERLEVDFRPGLKTTLGVRPIIEWRELQRP